MIERYSLQPSNFNPETPKELVILSIIAQSFFQPFSLEDNLLVILTALTAGSGIGFNRAMLFLNDGMKLKATTWLGPALRRKPRPSGRCCLRLVLVMPK